MRYKIEKGVPVQNGRRHTKYPFGQMEVGDSFVFEMSLRKKIRSAATGHAARNGQKFTFRKVDEDTCRCWRIK